MADGSWSQSACRGDVWWYGFPGQGCYYWTARFGTYWVGSPLSTYAAWRWECGQLGAPVKEFQFLSEFAAAGQWFEGGAIYFKGGSWKVAIGNFGQTAGRFAEDAGWPEGFIGNQEMPPTADPPPKPDPPNLPNSQPRIEGLAGVPELPVDDDPPAELDPLATSHRGIDQ